MRQSLTQRKLVSLFAAIVLAFSMLGVAPLAAFATADSAGSGELSAAEIGTPDRTATTITATTDEAVVAVGGTIDMKSHFSAPGLDPTSQHRDFKITNTSTDTGTATINKHSGVLTATGVGTVTVTAYLVNIAQPSGNPNNPCQTEIASATKTVTIGTSQAYGYQGSGFQIYLDSPAVGSAVLSGTTYTNTVTASQTAGSTVEFKVYQNAGLNQYTSYYGASYWNLGSPEAAYKALAGQYISYKAPGATSATTLASASASSGFAVTEVNSSLGYVKITVPVGSAGVGTLHFDDQLHTFKQYHLNQPNKYLGYDVDFKVTVAAPGGGD